jgi:Tfp pilus assembly protein PilO
MKDMSYRDKMVILVISIIVILVAGFFVLIKPAYNKMVTDTATYETTKTEWDGIKQKLDAIPALKEGITKMYQDAKKDAKVLENTAFGDVDKEYDVKKVNYGLDQYLQQTIDDNSLSVTEFTISGCGANSIEYYYYEPNVVTYALLETGDVNGNYEAEVRDLIKAGTVLSEREVASVLTNAISLEVEGKKEDLMNFLETMKADTNAININSLTIEDYSFSQGTSHDVVDEEGNVTTVKDANADGKSKMTIEMNFFNAKEMDNPDLGD